MRLIICLFVLIPIVVVSTAIITVIAYESVSLAIFHLREPRYINPIRTEAGTIPIRKDSRGNGEYGSRRRNGRSHSGIDILAPIGTPVRAAKSGVAFPGELPAGYGKYVMIYHQDRDLTFYGHLKESTVVSGQTVSQGDVIGFVGKTGNADSKLIDPHLHFEIRRRGIPADPRLYMK